MDSFRFLHAADLHLDSPLQGVSGRLPVEFAQRLRDASLTGLDRLVDVALHEQVALVLLAGDLYDGPHRGARAQVRLAQALARLDAAGIDVCIVLGNHDPVESGAVPGLSLPPRAVLFGSGAVETHELRREGKLLARVHGISHDSHETRENLALRFSRRGDGFEIGLLHASVEGNSDGYAAYAPCSIEDLRRSRLDYWALGHIHARKNLLAGDPWIVYPGNPQGRSFKPGERGAKGAVVVDVHGGRLLQPPRFVALDSVRFLELEQSIAGLDDWPRVVAAADVQASAARREHPGVDLILRLVLTGQGAVSRALSSAGGAADLLESLQERSDHGSGGHCWAELIDRTSADRDLAALRRRGDLLAAFLSRTEALMAAPGEAAAELDAVLGSLPAAVGSALRREGIELRDGSVGLLERAREHGLRLLDEPAGRRR